MKPLILPEEAEKAARKKHLQDGISAMNELIKLGFKSANFSFADQMDAEVGYVIGEPILFDSDGDPKSAHKMYQEYLYSIDPNGLDADIENMLNQEKQ